MIMENVTIEPFQNKKPVLGQEVFIASGARLSGDITIGNQSNIWFNVSMRGDVNYIRIGESTNIQDNTVIHVTHNGNPTLIGHRVTIGHGAIIHACTIEDEALIGMGAIILDGATIPSHCFVAAGALVSPGKTFPSGSLIVGAPAICKRKLSPTEIKNIQHSSQHYIDLAKRYQASSH